MKAQTMRKVRQVHHYVGLFFAPLLLLFSISGALQTFRLQEAHAPSDPKPPTWIVWMASIHKDQSLPRPSKAGAVSEHKSEMEAEHRPPSRDALVVPVHSTLPLKIFVTLMSAGLLLSTLLGITIALNNRATRRSSLALLTAGTVLPVLALWF
jgi:hypothetical protein